MSKSSNNIDSALSTINSMKLDEFKNNKDHVNLHETNRKRRFEDLREEESKPVNPNNNLPRKIIKVSTNQCEVPDSEIETLINEVSTLTSKSEIKNYLKQKINNFINKYSQNQQNSQLTNSNQKPLSETEESKDKKQKIIQELERLINDNKRLNKTVVAVYRAYEVKIFYFIILLGK